MDGVKLVIKNQNEKCSLCKKANESNEHLFVFCRKSIYFSICFVFFITFRFI